MEQHQQEPEKKDEAPQDKKEEQQDQQQQQKDEAVQLVAVEIETMNGKTKIEFQLPLIVQLSEVRHYLLESEIWYMTRYVFMHKGQKISDYTSLGSLLSEEARKSAQPRVHLKISTVPYDLQSALFHLRTLRKRIFPVPNTSSPSLFYSIAGSRSAPTPNEPAKKKKTKKNKNKKKLEAGEKTEANAAPVVNAPASSAPAPAPATAPVTDATATAPSATSASADVASGASSAAAAVAAVVAEPIAPVIVHVDADFSMEQPHLTDYFPKPVDVFPLALKDLSFSGWNPVSAQRRFQGDLFYVEVSTLENKTFVVTAGEKGWFVNKSSKNKLDVSHASQEPPHAVLADLLSSLSPLFRTNFAAINKLSSQVETIETLTFGGAPAPWVGQREALASAMAGRAEDTLLRLSGLVNAPGLHRDWNEEYQILFTQANIASDNRFATLNNLFRVHSEFVEACQKGAVAVVDGEIASINPYEPVGSQMWMHNNIFFSVAANVNGMFDGLGGDLAAHKNASHEITGIRLLRSAGVAGLSACAQCIVDYRGKRVICQSVVPGLLSQGDLTLNMENNNADGDAPAAPPNSHTFGPTDDMSAYIENAEFSKMTSELGRRLGLCKTNVRVGEKTIEVHGPLELRGLVGGDKRKYVFELLRLLPRDTNQKEREKSYCLFRPELLRLFREQQTTIALRKYAEKKKQREEAAKQKEAEAKAADESEDVIYLPDMSVNVNLMVHDDRLVYEKKEAQENETALLDSIGKFLTSLIIPNFVAYCVQNQQIPTDSSVLVAMMHEQGINARYLGEIARLAANSAPSLSALCVEEMLIRGVKHLMRAELATASPGESSAVAARVLNRFLGGRYQKAGAKPSFAGDIPFWEQLRSQVQSRFSHSLVVDAKLSSKLRKMALLRGVCLAVGITIEAIPYNFESSDPFTSDHILAFHPVARHAPPELPDLSDMMTKARDLLARAESIGVGLEMLEHTLQAVYHIMGPHTQLAATAHQLLASAYFQLGDPGFAIQHMERAVLILERLCGLDHDSTLRAYANLSTYYVEGRLGSLALPFLRRSMYLERLIFGPEDLGLCRHFTLLANTLHQLGDSAGATRALLFTLQIYEKMGNEVMVTHTCRELALVYQASGFFKEALGYEKRYNKVISRFYAADDAKVKESNDLLSTLTGQAVHEARERAKQVQARAAASGSTSSTRQQSGGKARMSVLPKPGSANMAPLSRVLNLINKGRKE